MPTFYAIAAMSENRVIGNQGKIPWHIPDDFRWFKHKTMGGTLVMGRKTFDSIGKPLPGRKTLVLTHRPLNVPGVDTCSDLRFFLTQYVKEQPQETTYWVCGGGTIYNQLLDLCAYLYLTIVKREVKGDAYFPDKWHVEKNHTFDQVIHDTPEFRIERWKRTTNRLLEPISPPETWPFSS